jgi:hypothetical protein
MAKRHLDLRGAKGPKLGLDFLRLVMAVRDLRSAGNEAQGYLLVLTNDIAGRVATWVSKYRAGDAVQILRSELLTDHVAQIRQEVESNIQGMVAKFRGEDVGGRSDASFGAGLLETELREAIGRHEHGVVQVCDPPLLPFGIR